VKFPVQPTAAQVADEAPAPATARARVQPRTPSADVDESFERPAGADQRDELGDGARQAPRPGPVVLDADSWYDVPAPVPVDPEPAGRSAVSTRLWVLVGSSSPDLSPRLRSRSR
jgi:hypothetical protein